MSSFSFISESMEVNREGITTGRQTVGWRDEVLRDEAWPQPGVLWMELAGLCTLHGCCPDHLLGDCPMVRGFHPKFSYSYPALKRWMSAQVFSRGQLRQYVQQVKRTALAIRIVYEQDKKERSLQRAEFGMMGENDGSILDLRNSDIQDVGWSWCWRGKTDCGLCLTGKTCL